MAGAKISAGEFLHISGAELARARRRVRSPEWAKAAELVRREAEVASQNWAQLPQFDSAWFDAEPGRNYNQTYNEFAAYAYPAWKLLDDALKMLLADAVFAEERYTPAALAWTMHVVNHFRFHVQHHDSGLSYSHAAHALATIVAYAGGRFSQKEREACVAQLEACAQALRHSTQHWLTNLAKMPYNNHFAHHRSGLLAIGLLLGREAWIDEALNGPRSFGELLVGATTDDGWCYESSTVYHFVTLGGLLQTAELAAHHPELRRDLFREIFANGRCLKQMFDAPLKMLFPGGESPAVGDCYWYRQPLWEIRAGIYELAYGVYGDPRYAWLLARAGQRQTLEGLLYGAERLQPVQPPQVRSRLWVEHGWALVTSRSGADYWQGGAVAAFITGDQSGIHHHQDALSLQVAMGGRLAVEDVESRAVELQGFAAPIQNAFNRTMLAHNLVVVDEEDQADNPQALPVAEFKDLPGCATVAMGDQPGVLSPGVRRLRNVAVTEEYCLDVYQVASATEHLYEWLLHPRAERKAACGGLTFSPKILPDRPPYAVLRDALAATVAKDGAAIEWAQAEARFRCDVAAGVEAELVSAQWPTHSDGTGEWREMLMLRVRAKRTDFVALYQMAAAARLWRVAKAQRVFNGQVDEVRVELTDGVDTRHHWLKSL